MVGRNAPGSPAPAPRPAGETDHFKLALYYQRVGDFENALIHYRAVIAADELNAEAHNNLGVLYQGKGLYDEAIHEFQRATFIDPRYDKAHNNLGVALLRSGKTDAAIAEFRADRGARRDGTSKRSPTWPSRSRPPAAPRRPASCCSGC